MKRYLKKFKDFVNESISESRRLINKKNKKKK